MGSFHWDPRWECSLRWSVCVIKAGPRANVSFLCDSVVFCMFHLKLPGMRAGHWNSKSVAVHFLRGEDTLRAPSHTGSWFCELSQLEFQLFFFFLLGEIKYSNIVSSAIGNFSWLFFPSEMVYEIIWNYNFLFLFLTAYHS